MKSPRERAPGAASGAETRERGRADLEEHADRFRERFGSAGSPRIFFSPGRVNLMGAHLDYNGGPVMPTAIDKGTFIAVRPRGDRIVRLASTLDATRLELDLDRLRRERTSRWTDYPAGVLFDLLDRAEGSSALRELPGVEILFGGNLPVGAGLSSSASICVGTALALDSVWGLSLSRLQLVHAALNAEREFVGVRCGIMDPYAVGMARAGHLLWLDCKDASSAYIPLDSSRYSIAVADTLVRRELAAGAFNERVRQCASAFEELKLHQPEAVCLRDIRLDVLDAHRHDMDPVLAMRAEHVVREVARTFAARAALERGDAKGFGERMIETHESLRGLFEVSVPELDQLVQSAVACEGVLGARLTGAGFGGCVVALLEAGAGTNFQDRLVAEYRSRFGREPVIALFESDAGPREVAGPWG